MLPNRHLQPGAFGRAPHPPDVEFVGAGARPWSTTVPLSVTPPAVHSQYPPTGIVVPHDSFSALQVPAANAGLPATSSDTRLNMAVIFMIELLPKMRDTQP